jgi:hypothetical protein
MEALTPATTSEEILEMTLMMFVRLRENK